MVVQNRNIKKSKIGNIHCVWGLICSLSSIDQEKNNISLFDVVEEINIKKNNLPSRETKKGKILLVPFPHEIILLFRRRFRLEISSEELITDCKINLIDSRGIILQEIITPLKIQKQKRRLRFRVRVGNLAVTDSGDYIYEIQIKEPGKDNFSTAFKIPFEVTIS